MFGMLEGSIREPALGEIVASKAAVDATRMACSISNRNDLLSEGGWFITGIGTIFKL